MSRVGINSSVSLTRQKPKAIQNKHRPPTERRERRLFPQEQLVKASTLLANHHIDWRTIEATMKGPTKHERTTHHERPCTARSIARTNQKRKPSIKTDSAPFDAFVGRYYPTVYSFASRLTDDPREATLLTHEAFDRLRKQLRTCRDESVLASILMSILIRAGLGTA